MSGYAPRALETVRVHCACRTRLRRDVLAEPRLGLGKQVLHLLFLIRALD